VPEWLRFFRDGRPVQEWLDRLAAVREVLQGGRRSRPAGALGWILARSPRMIPIPSFRTAQVEENLAVLGQGPLEPAAFGPAEELLGR
jgi:aryl-alcohol dehydrogenase-like predicted oxidoreductase